MPPYTPAFDNSLAQPCSDLKTRWLEWKDGPSPFGPEDLANFTSGQKIEFLAQLVELEPSLSASAVGAMEEAYGLAASTNSEIKFRWIRLGLRARSEPAVDLAVQMVTEQGRMKFLRYTLRIFDSFFMLNTFKNTFYNKCSFAVLFTETCMPGRRRGRLPWTPTTRSRTPTCTLREMGWRRFFTSTNLESTCILRI